MFWKIELLVMAASFMCFFCFQIFNGNSGRQDVVKHNLVSFTRARFVKFQPTKFNNQKALRVEVYGVPVPAGRISRILVYYLTSFCFLFKFASCQYVT